MRVAAFPPFVRRRVLASCRRNRGPQFGYSFGETEDFRLQREYEGPGGSFCFQSSEDHGSDMSGMGRMDSAERSTGCWLSMFALSRRSRGALALGWFLPRPRRSQGDQSVRSTRSARGRCKRDTESVIRRLRTSWANRQPLAGEEEAGDPAVVQFGTGAPGRPSPAVGPWPQ